MNFTVVALGDSFSCGEGVGLDIRPDQTWTALLCAAFPRARLVNLSAAGARVRDVRRHQLPAAVAAQPHLATIMVGLNDVIRSGLRAEQLSLDMRALVDELRAGGAAVLIARWHDPGAVLGLPTGFRRALATRLAWVNDAVDAAVAGATDPHAVRHNIRDLDVIVGSGPHSGQRTDNNVKITRKRGPSVITTLDLGCIPELTDPGAWAVDGVHPSPAGHRAIALSAARILTANGTPGLRIPPVADLLPMPPGACGTRRARWLLSRGLPWLVQHSGRVAPAVTSMATQAIREQRRAVRTPLLPIRERAAAQDVGCLVGVVESSGSAGPVR